MILEVLDTFADTSHQMINVQIHPHFFQVYQALLACATRIFKQFDDIEQQAARNKVKERFGNMLNASTGKSAKCLPESADMATQTAEDVIQPPQQDEVPHSRFEIPLKPLDASGFDARIPAKGKAADVTDLLVGSYKNLKSIYTILTCFETQKKIPLSAVIAATAAEAQSGAARSDMPPSTIDPRRMHIDANTSLASKAGAPLARSLASTSTSVSSSIKELEDALTTINSDTGPTVRVSTRVTRAKMAQGNAQAKAAAKTQVTSPESSDLSELPETEEQG